MPRLRTSGHRLLVYGCIWSSFRLHVSVIHYNIPGEDIAGLGHCFREHIQTGIGWILPQVNGLPVAEVMDTWTKQMGYPVLDLFISGRAATLTQKRFLLDPKADPSQPPSPLGSDILNGFRNLFLLNSIIVTDVSIQTVVTLALSYL